MHILIMLILISLLILVHELGHFLAARAFGIRVVKFAIGLPFGPVLYRKQFGDTEILVHAFLFGGYVAFLDDETEKTEKENIPKDSPLHFKNKKPWQRATVLFAGVFSNVLFAIFLVMFCATFYHKLPSSDIKVYISGFEQNIGSNIEAQGAKAGDEILTLNGVKINSPSKFILVLKESDKPVSIDVLRDGKVISLKDIKKNKDGILGVRLNSESVYKKIETPLDVITESSKYLWENTYLMCVGLWQICTGKIPISEMHGIVVITKVGGDIIEHQGLLSGLLLTAIISMDLAIINLLPIPALDGGHLFILFLEKLLGRKLDEKKIEKISNICFFALLALMILIIFNDIFALVTKKF